VGQIQIVPANDAAFYQAIAGFRDLLFVLFRLALQMDALRDIGCERICVEKASSSHRDRPQLKAALDYLRTLRRASHIAKSCGGFGTFIQMNPTL
jgi:hypothetical protein